MTAALAARLTAAATLVGALLGPAAASAQAIDLRAPEPAAAQLADARLVIAEERRAAGVALLSGGLLSLVGGGAVALAGGLETYDPFALGFGVGAAGWGLINAALSFGLLDVDGGARAAIEADRALRGEERSEAREHTLRAQHGSATLFALNVGLDVAYVISAALLYWLADSIGSPADADALRGYSVAQLSQGAFLLVFDVCAWIAAEGWADGVARTPR